MKHDWKTWEAGMKLYVPYKKEIRAAKGIECPICRGTGKILDPFTQELYFCPGVVSNRIVKHECFNGKVFPLTISYKFKEYELEKFTVEYPSEKLNSITLNKYNEDWLDNPFSHVTFSHQLDEMYFFKTKKEAQEYCDKMNQEMENKDDK